MLPVLSSFWKHSATTSSKNNTNEFCLTVKVNYIQMTVSHNRLYLPWHLAHILSISMHDAAVFSSKAKRLWPLYTSTKVTNIFLFFFFLLFVILLLRYYIQCKYCIQVWINWTELNWMVVEAISEFQKLSLSKRG